MVFNFEQSAFGKRHCAESFTRRTARHHDAAPALRDRTRVLDSRSQGWLVELAQARYIRQGFDLT